MVKHTFYLSLALLGAALVGGCRTPDPAHAPARAARLVPLQGTLKLIDGTVVPGADITALCGGVRRITVTDLEGRFALGAVPKGTCQISSTKAKLSTTISSDDNILHGGASVSLILPPAIRATFAVPGQPAVSLDSRLKPVTVVGDVLLALESEQLRVMQLDCSTCKPKTLDLVEGIKIDAGLRDGRRIDYVTVEKVERRAWIPLALRDTPRPGDTLSLNVLTTNGELSHLHAAPRQVLVLARPGAMFSTSMLSKLDLLAATYRDTGLKVAWFWVGRDDRTSPLESRLLSCKSETGALFRGLKDLPVKGKAEQDRNADRNKSLRAFLLKCLDLETFSQPLPGGPIYRAGPELLWALDAAPGQFVVIDWTGQVLFKKAFSSDPHADPTIVADVVAYLERTWPAFAARRRISVTAAPSVRTAEAVRLTEQIDARLLASDFAEAHRLLDQLVDHSPDLAEAHKLRALVKARLGDVTGAMQEVSWWQSSFGSEAADDLMDQVRQASKGRLGALRTAATAR